MFTVFASVLTATIFFIVTVHKASFAINIQSLQDPIVNVMNVSHRETFIVPILVHSSSDFVQGFLGVLFPMEVITMNFTLPEGNNFTFLVNDCSIPPPFDGWGIRPPFVLLSQT